MTGKIIETPSNYRIGWAAVITIPYPEPIKDARNPGIITLARQFSGDGPTKKAAVKDARQRVKEAGYDPKEHDVHVHKYYKPQDEHEGINNW